MHNLPLVSICIPTYNAGEFFEPCLQSALAQTYPNTEILISDDGSTDETISLAKQYSQSHAHIRIVRNAKGGMVNNWNNCIKEASGEWIKYLFQDDILEPACVATMIDACVKHDVHVGLCRREFIIHDDVPKRTRHTFKYRMVLPERVFGKTGYISPQLLAKEVAELLPENILGEPTCYLFNKKIFEHTGMFDQHFKQVVDMELLLRLGLIKGLVFIAETLAHFRVHGKSESSANLKEEKEQIRNIAAVTGDTILLYYKFLHDPSFQLIKDAVGEDVLQLQINHLYYSGCKHKGQKIFNKALEPIRKEFRDLGEMKYSFFKYMHYRKLFKSWEKQNRH